ncbi:MAG: hypothetical protein HY690_18215 [Chloroflexi bacterium]|nr:hypothetical protein [Chloroflexota bacterium]
MRRGRDRKPERKPRPVLDESSSFLFARPSFIDGLARLFDFGNTLTVYNTSARPEWADFLALKSDWMAVGNDVRRAEQEFAARSGYADCPA